MRAGTTEPVEAHFGRVISVAGKTGARGVHFNDVPSVLCNPIVISDAGLIRCEELPDECDELEVPIVVELLPDVRTVADEDDGFENTELVDRGEPR